MKVELILITFIGTKKVLVSEPNHYQWKHNVTTLNHVVEKYTLSRTLMFTDKATNMDAYTIARNDVSLSIFEYSLFSIF